ncbi:pinensin family lanthipeptide [Fulvivirga ulvae]|uniref:pinensin family lanthipeptide n=1 Tax=Fulvivirga ulvae TaxID=2904245 RepID=UPI001F45F23A|nr:pinensin family lanthipeptide [Fulvivirga ulvae]UII32938.1 pinensin family lanthipeptide [Fulvivirga ulvae]
MKKKKMKLDELKVKSFITEEFNEKAETVKGGAIIINPSYIDGCRSALIQCDPQTLAGCGTTTIGNSRICSWNDGCGSALGCTTTTFDTGGLTIGGGTGY